MVFFTLCGACSTGDHANHDGSHHGPVGLIGGWSCICPGDCKPLDLTSIFRAAGSDGQ